MVFGEKQEKNISIRENTSTKFSVNREVGEMERRPGWIKWNGMSKWDKLGLKRETMAR